MNLAFLHAPRISEIGQSIDIRALYTTNALTLAAENIFLRRIVTEGITDGCFGFDVANFRVVLCETIVD
jgi:hypothetical protein